MVDEKVVQSDVVSLETPLPEVEVVKPEPQPQPLTEADIRRIVDEATESGRRELQSFKDKAKAEVEQAQLRARDAEGTTTAIRQKLQEVDPDAAKDARIVELEGKLRQSSAGIYQEQRRTQAQAFADRFTASKTQSIKNLGIDPNDKRIDWGADAKDYWEADQRISASTTKILKEDAKTQADKVKQEAEDKIAREREGVDSVDTSASGGAGSSWQNLSASDKIRRGLAKK